jgi:hypothetical protein
VGDAHSQLADGVEFADQHLVPGDARGLLFQAAHQDAGLPDGHEGGGAQGRQGEQGDHPQADHQPVSFLQYLPLVALKPPAASRGTRTRGARCTAAWFRAISLARTSPGSGRMRQDLVDLVEDGAVQDGSGQEGAACVHEKGFTGPPDALPVQQGAEQRGIGREADNPRVSVDPGPGSDLESAGRRHRERPCDEPEGPHFPSRKAGPRQGSLRPGAEASRQRGSCRLRETALPRFPARAWPGAGAPSCRRMLARYRPRHRWRGTGWRGPSPRRRVHGRSAPRMHLPP